MSRPPGSPLPAAPAQPLVEARRLAKHYRLSGGWLAGPRVVVRAVDGVDLAVQPGEVLGLVGESGCGKSTLGRLLLGLIPPTSGQVLFQGQDLARLSGEALRRLRREMQIIFQSPLGSFSPRLKVVDSVAEPLRTHAAAPARDLRAQVLALLQAVGLGSQHLDRFPHELSGGQCQRVALARALALRPRLIVLDEPTSALDVSVQAQILNLLLDLRQAHDLTYLFISHDLNVVQHVSHRMGVMYLGQLVELGPSSRVFTDPQHPYTRALLASIPRLESAGGRSPRRPALAGVVPSPANPPAGCRFHTRCPMAEPVCRVVEPPLRRAAAGWSVACHLVEPVQVPQLPPQG